MSAHTASLPDTTDARPPAYLGGPDQEIQAGGRCWWEICAITPAIGWLAGWPRLRQPDPGDRAESSSDTTHRLAGSGRRRHRRYSPVPWVIVLHVQ